MKFEIYKNNRILSAEELDNIDLETGNVVEAEIHYKLPMGEIYRIKIFSQNEEPIRIVIHWDDWDDKKSFPIPEYSIH